MPISDVACAASRQDYKAFGSRLNHHGTIPRTVDVQDAFFVQHLKLRGVGGGPIDEPSVLVWFRATVGRAVGFWLEGDEGMRIASSVMRECEKLPSDKILSHLNDTLTPDVAVPVIWDAESLEELVDRRQENL